MIWLAYTNNVIGYPELAEKNFYDLYRYATGLEPSDVKRVFNISTAISDELSYTIARSEPFDQASPSTPTGSRSGKFESSWGGLILRMRSWI